MTISVTSKSRPRSIKNVSHMSSGIADLNVRKSKLTTKRATYVEMLLNPKSTAITKDTSQDYLKDVVRKLADIEIFLVRLGVTLMSCRDYARSQGKDLNLEFLVDCAGAMYGRWAEAP
jgi:hypothetical protein